MSGLDGQDETGDFDQQLITVIDPTTGLVASVELDSGKNKLLTKTDVNVNELLGKDPIPDSYFVIDHAGAISDSIRVEIVATTNDPTTPDRDAPAVDVTIVVTASEAGDELKLRDFVIDELNDDTNFKASFKAQKAKDNAIIHVTSIFRGDFYERPNVDDFKVTTPVSTGGIAITVGFNNIIQRQKIVSLARDPDAPHELGVLGISGSVSVFPTGIEDRIEELLTDPVGLGTDMRVDGSSVNVDFEFKNNFTDKIVFVTQIRLFGGGNGIKFDQFLSKSGSGGLTNGLLANILSNGFSTSLIPIKTTEDFKNLFASSAGEFAVDVQSGADQFIAVLTPALPFPLQPGGTDFIRVTVRDDITSGLSQLQGLIAGFGKVI